MQRVVRVQQNQLYSTRCVCCMACFDTSLINELFSKNQKVQSRQTLPKTFLLITGITMRRAGPTRTSSNRRRSQMCHGHQAADAAKARSKSIRAISNATIPKLPVSTHQAATTIRPAARPVVRSSWTCRACFKRLLLHTAARRRRRNLSTQPSAGARRSTSSYFTRV